LNNKFNCSLGDDLPGLPAAVWVRGQEGQGGSLPALHNPRGGRPDGECPGHQGVLSHQDPSEHRGAMDKGSQIHAYQLGLHKVLSWLTCLRKHCENIIGL
jgi:hypothetical protein